MRLFSKNIRSRGGRISQKPGPRYFSGSGKTPGRSPFQRRPATPKTKMPILKKIRNILITIIILAGFVYSQILKSESKLTISDSSYHALSDYKTSVDSHLKALRNRAKITFDRDGVSAILKKQFPEIAKVDIDLPFYSQMPVFKLDIAAPTFNLKSGNNLYVVSANGVVVALSGQLPGLAHLPTVTDQSGFEASPGKQVLGKQAITFINNLLAQCKQASVTVESLVLPAAPQALELKAVNAPYFVKFDLNGDVLLQAGQYLAAKKKFEAENNYPSQYLDVRVAGKIYYK